jgi:hypothetical protein
VSTGTRFHILLGACALLVVGALLPWATAIAPFVGTISAAWTDGDGVIALVLGLLVGACGIVGLRSQRGKAAKIAGAIGLVVAAVIGCYDVATIYTMQPVTCPSWTWSCTPRSAWASGSPLRRPWAASAVCSSPGRDEPRRPRRRLAARSREKSSI